MTSTYYDKLFSPWQLGASLYMPAHRADLTSIANGDKLPGLRSMIFCTEDAIADDDVGRSLEHLRGNLKDLADLPDKFRFIRVRNPDILSRLLDLPGIGNIDGFVLPKFNESNFRAYFDLLQGGHFKLMPTLETRDVFVPAAMAALREELLREEVFASILMLRIGGNDLMNLLGIRRPRGFTLYQTPMAQVIAHLACTFKPYGFHLSAPVFEYLNDTATLRAEIGLDLAHGLTGKTAIHPGQIAAIESCYTVGRDDYEMALSLCDQTASAVFRMHDAMCEVATHQQWARAMLNRQRCFGVEEAIPIGCEAYVQTLNA